MKKIYNHTAFLFFTLAFFITCSSAKSEAASTLTVENIVIAKKVVDKNPEGIANSFVSDVERVYCYSKIIGATEPTSVTHVWYFGEKKMAEVTLPVTTPRYRTFSSKKIISSWKGSWRVDVLAEDQSVLASVTFDIK